MRYSRLQKVCPDRRGKGAPTCGSCLPSRSDHLVEPCVRGHLPQGEHLERERVYRHQRAIPAAAATMPSARWPAASGIPGTALATTVERHIANIFLKIEVSSRAEAAVFAVEHGLHITSRQS